MDVDPRDGDSVRRFLQLAADLNYPGHAGGALCIQTPLGPVVVPIAPAPRPADVASRPAGG